MKFNCPKIKKLAHQGIIGFVYRLFGAKYSSVRFFFPQFLQQFNLATVTKLGDKMDAYLGKPFSPDDVANILRRWTRAAGG